MNSLWCFSYYNIKSTCIKIIVFKMIEKKLLAKTEEDTLSDFNSVYDFSVAFANILAQTVEFKNSK